MKVSIGDRIAVASGIALAALLIVSAVAYGNLKSLGEDMRWVRHTHEVLEAKERLSGKLTETQGAARGFALSGEETLRNDFEQAAAEMRQAYDQIKTITADNPKQQEQLRELEPLLARRLESARRLVNMRVAAGSGQNSVYGDIVREGNTLSEQIYQIASNIENEEERLLAQRQTRTDATAAATTATLLYGTLLSFILVSLACWALIRSIRRPLGVLSEGANRLARGEYSHRVVVQTQDEIRVLADVFNEMATQIEQRQIVLSAEDWLKTSLARFARMFEGQRDSTQLYAAVLKEIVALTSVRHAVVYVPMEDARDSILERKAVYAADHAPMEIAAGQGLIGQSFVERQRILITEVPQDYIKINSALGQSRPAALVVLPAVLNGEVEAVLELAGFQPFSSNELTFLDQFADSFAVVLHTIAAGLRTERLLEEAKQMAAELAAQQEDLEQRNVELEAQSARLRQSEKLLQEQQDELRQSNEELEQANEELEQTNQEVEERASLLSEQKVMLERTNKEVEDARRALVTQSEALEQNSKYKSEFLANMSHELRTPLNSLLILSKILAENAEANLSAKQVQHARTINAAGNDLLELINDILDLSKIEAGAMETEIAPVPLAEITQLMEDTFRHVAQNKGLAFSVHGGEGLPLVMETDQRRIVQILRNLLANAFKFTQQGSVELHVEVIRRGWDTPMPALDNAALVLAFTVKDTGIGIAADRQKMIFDAFQQADAGTARKYGGTGLGLSISRDLAKLLGGALQVHSTLGVGSSFALLLPAIADTSRPAKPAIAEPRTLRAATKPAAHSSASHDSGEPHIEVRSIADDRENLQQGDLVLLIIEDDMHFAGILGEFARERGFKIIIAPTATSGISFAKRLKPTAITLDLQLPDSDGRVVLDVLKHDMTTRHIPVHVISVSAERERILKQGAVSYLRKPVTKESIDAALDQTLSFVKRTVKQLLIVEDDVTLRSSIVELIGNSDVESTAVGTFKAASEQLQSKQYDCVVLDLNLPDGNGMELIRQMHRRSGEQSPPVIIYTAKSLSRAEETELRKMSEAIIVKDVRSPERLLDETALFLHRRQGKLPEAKRRLIEQAQHEDSVLSGRKVLVVDDDVRNIFAITAALESYRMQVVYAESGKAALEMLEAQRDVEVVLMDVMMPEMDGFEATRILRSRNDFSQLPVIMVTAKAMKGDREKCLAAGASDYITKPVDMDQLRSLLRVWLYR